MLTSLSKSQKKVARTLIDLALERECAKLIRKVSKLTGKSLGDVEKPNHARYLEKLRFGKKNASFKKMGTFRFADYGFIAEFVCKSRNFFGESGNCSRG